jgi:biopolymer transport protein ExbB
MNSIIILTDIIEKLVLLILAGLSIWSISIIIDRKRVLKAEGAVDYAHLRTAFENKNFAALNSWTEPRIGFISGAIRVLVASGKNATSIERSLASYMKMEKMKLEKGLAVLATLGSNAPFIGLFGTVLGIIRSFAYLGSQSGSNAVMSGVSQALYATAIGLFVAIPAVVAFNIFSKKIRELTLTVESLRDLHISKLDS